MKAAGAADGTGSARIMMQVEDDGIGFEPSDQDEKSIGLTAMRERVELLGGKFRIAVIAPESSPRNCGTRIVVDLPLPEGASRG